MPTKIPRAKSKPEELFALQVKATRDNQGITIIQPEREVLCYPGRKWRVDFFWRTHGVVVEIEGGTHTNGRHVRADGFEKDCEKYNALAERGLRVFRFTSQMVKDGRAIEQIRRVLG